MLFTDYNSQQTDIKVILLLYTTSRSHTILYFTLLSCFWWNGTSPTSNVWKDFKDSSKFGSLFCNNKYCSWCSSNIYSYKKSKYNITTLRLRMPHNFMIMFLINANLHICFSLILNKCYFSTLLYFKIITDFHIWEIHSTYSICI